VTLGGAARGRAKSNEILVPLDPGACSPQKWRGTPARVPGGAAATPARAPLAPLPALCENVSENFSEEGSSAPEVAALAERLAAAGLSPPLARRASSGSGASAGVSLSQAADKVAGRCPPPPPFPFPRTKWTRRVPRPVLIRHAASLAPY
jgi:hypothetical protein